MKTREPVSFTAGDTVTWLKSLSDYPASAGWTLKYTLAGPSVINLTTSPEGDSHRQAIAASATATFSAGDYWWTSYVEKGAERYTIDRGKMTIKSDPANLSAGYDGRSHVKKVLDAIEAAIENRADGSQLDIVASALAGRSMTRNPENLVKLRQLYKAEYRREQAAERIRKGGAPSGKLHMRF